MLPALALLLAACGSGDDAGARRVAVLAAFPGELAALVERAEITGTVTLAGLEERRFRTATLGGVPVVLGMTGIGLANAARTTRAVLDHFSVTGVVVSGVAGSPQRIGDVVVADSWVLGDGERYGVDRRWLKVAGDVARAGVEGFATCVEVAPDLGPSPVCIEHQPALIVGGSGHSSGFAVEPLSCRRDGDDVFGCDIAPLSANVGVEGVAGVGSALAAVSQSFAVEDMESAAVAREAAAGALPFIAFRGVSDGAGDPLGLPGFPAQFFAYYPLAAANAARSVEAFLATLRGLPAGGAVAAARRLMLTSRTYGKCLTWRPAVEVWCGPYGKRFGRVFSFGGSAIAAARFRGGAVRFRRGSAKERM